MEELPADKVFDASQYAFFGRDVSQEIEIGGLDEEDGAEEAEEPEDGEGAFSLGGLAEELHSDTRRPECETGCLGSGENEPKSEGGEAAIPFSQFFEPIPPANWFDEINQESSVEQDVKKFLLDKQTQPTFGVEVDGSLGPSHQAQRQPWWVADPSSVQDIPSSALYPLHRTQQAVAVPSAGHVQAIQAPSGQGTAGTLPGPYRQPYFALQVPMQGMPSMASYGVNCPQYSSSGGIIAPLVHPTQWLAPVNVQPVQGPQASLMPPQVVLQCQHRHPPQQLHLAPSPQNPPRPRPQHLPHGTPLSPQMLPKVGHSLVNGDLRDFFRHRGRPTQRHYQHGVADGNVSGRNAQNNNWQGLRSKYMTVEELENIVRIQWAATHSGDPYIDDYYHQAVQAQVSAGSPNGRRHFAPSHLRDLPSHTRATVEPHAYLQVDALGRVPFSSIRRPRPLLEVDSSSGSSALSEGRQGDNLVDVVPQHRPLEQEPLLAARIAIEDGLCLLLDVDDIDRLLSSSQPPDGGAQLKRRRQLLLEGLTASLQLPNGSVVDAGGRDMDGWFTRFSVNDDLVFLRLVSLPKGRKFLTRFFQLLTPGSELVHVVTMAIFRNLRSLFGGGLPDPSTSATTVALANATAVSVLSLDLPALSTCLAAAVLAPEQPPLRPMGSQAGDGATVVLRAVLKRATDLLTDRNAAYSMQDRALWQTAFDAFFALVARYCTNKYASIFHSLMMTSPGNSAAKNSAAAARAMSKEMPVELLRASLPHTNDNQRKLLLEFAQDDFAVGAFSSNVSNDSYRNTSAVRG